MTRHLNIRTCGHLKIIDPDKLIGSGIIGPCGLAKGDVLPGIVFAISDLHHFLLRRLLSLSLSLPLSTTLTHGSAIGSKLSVTAPCYIHACLLTGMTPTMVVMDYSSETVSKIQVKCYLS